ncbi:MAG: glycerate kinase [Kiloniellales bacterium]|nr:glycerate kinase [Kiloniellales bacterium]
MTVAEPRAFLRRLFQAALDAADPALVVPPHLPPPPSGRTLVLGAGKASAAMAAAVEANWPAERLDDLSGLVVTRYGHGTDCRRIEIVEAAHPVPDPAGRRAAERILELARDAGPDDLVLCLISGGGSALLSLPAAGVTLEDKQEVSRTLLRCGATISEMNCLRKHLSAIKGGRLAAAAAPAKVLTLLISDVPGDDPATIASGPTVPDPTSFAEARAVLERYGITPPDAVQRHLAAAEDETPKPGDPRLAGAEAVMVARPVGALEAAAEAVRAAGADVRILGDDLEGEARDLGRQQAEEALALLPVDRPLVLLSGGETTVTMTGKGRGGRNAEYLLGLTLAAAGDPRLYAIACDTDGIDGSEDNAGAITGPDSLGRARDLGLDPEACLAGHDSYGFFEALHDLVVTGATLTNVNDFRAILLLPE